jgi:ADP-ribose pyrophosphatase YjhB (NUDIX family)
MSDREPLSIRLVESVEARLRRRLTPRGLRAAYRLGYLVLRPWWMIARPQTRGVKAVVCRAGEVLLVQHTYVRRGQWDIPGGFLHPGEDPEPALRRELREELGLEAGAMTNIAATRTRADHKREELFAYAVEVGAGEVRPSTAEIAKVGWFAHDALPAATTRLARRMVARAYWEYWAHDPDAAGAPR